MGGAAAHTPPLAAAKKNFGVTIVRVTKGEEIFSSFFLRFYMGSSATLFSPPLAAAKKKIQHGLGARSNLAGRSVCTQLFGPTGRVAARQIGSVGQNRF